MTALAPVRRKKRSRLAIPSSPRSLPETGFARGKDHEFGAKREVADFAHLEQAVVSGGWGGAKDQGCAIGELGIGYAVNGQVYDSEVLQWQSLEGGFCRVGFEKELAGP
jgi:hypothetical protein